MKNPDEIIMDLPNNIAKHRRNRKVCIDREISKTIQYLWDNCVNTLGCCYGHKIRKPSVIVSGDYKIKDIKRIISEIDNREWEIIRKKLT